MRKETACFTGHRRIPADQYATMNRRLMEAITDLIDRGYRYFGIGGALGFDTMAAQAVIALKMQYSHIRLILVLPCVSQANSWNAYEQDVYETTKKQADKVVYTSTEYAKGCMHKRNRYLVDNSSACVCCLTHPTGGTAYTVAYARKKKSEIIRPAAGDYRLSGKICARTLTLGMTSFLSQISLVAAMAAINNMLRKYGALDSIFSQAQYAQVPMAVVGIVMKFFQIVIAVVVGMAAGCIPIAGFNMGAGHRERVRELFTRLLAAEALTGLAALLLAEVFPRPLIAVFGTANESVYYTEFAVRAFRVYLCMVVFACVNKACFIFLQAMGKALASTALSMVREVVFGVGFALLLPRFFGLDGVLYSMPVSDLLTFAMAAYLIRGTYRELGPSFPV